MITQLRQNAHLNANVLGLSFIVIVSVALLAIRIAAGFSEIGHPGL